MLKLFLLSLLAISSNLLADSDDFDPLPAEEPRCIFQSSVTRTVRNKPEVLHQATHSTSGNSSLEPLITKGCRACRKALSSAVADLRKRNIFFFEDKCYFEKCTYGESDSDLYISEEVFKKALSDSQDLFYCGTRSNTSTSSN